MARSRRSAPAEGSSRVTLSNKALRNQDEKCKVRVYLTGMDPQSGKPLPNNITTTMFIGNITVTEAAETIRSAFE